MSEIEELARLVGVQALDREIARLHALTDEKIPLEVEALEKEVAAARARVEELRQAGAERTKKRRQQEGDLKTAQDKLQHIKHGLHAIKSNREYTAAMNEIAAGEEAISRLEDALLELMEEGERAERELVRREREQKGEEAGVRGRQEVLRQELAALQAELEETKTARAREAGEVSAELLARYEKIRANKNGVAVVPLADGVCGGCASRLPPQLGLEVRAGEGLHYCPFCGRILHALGEKSAADAMTSEPAGPDGAPGTNAAAGES
jgi:predicted  nucleic acid-binding Zn-ribbon protein